MIDYSLKKSAQRLIEKITSNHKLTLDNLAQEFNPEEYVKSGNDFFVDGNCYEFFNAGDNHIIYIHGGGWTGGSVYTHGEFVSRLSEDTNSNVTFIDYTLAPKAKFPTQISEIVEAIKSRFGVFGIADCYLSGDSAGGNLAIAVALSLARQGIYCNGLILYYPVTNWYFDTESYNRYATGYYLTKQKMIEFWNAYLRNKEDGINSLASPLKLSEEAIKKLPRTLIINGECDVLRDDGIEFAKKLRRSGVECDNYVIGGMIHDFLILKETARDYMMMADVMWLTRNFIGEGY